MKILLILTLLAVGLFSVTFDENADVFGHGGNGVDRAPAIDFGNRNATVEVRMSPSDMTVGDFSNTFMEVTFLDEDTGESFNQVTYAVDVYKKK